MIKLLILGPTGSMGKLITELALNDSEIKVVAACDILNIGDNLENLVNVKDSDKIKISDLRNIQNIIDKTQPDVVVDFTIAEATEKNCLICAKNGIRCVIGTTALSEEFLENFEQIVKENNAPAVISSNMATGVNVFFKMLSLISPYLKDWDIEVIESHHNRKVDSPSGTSITAGKIISSSIGCDFNYVAKFGRDKGPNKRKIGALNEIGFHSIRAGDIIGDHIILYAGPGERIEFKHQAHSRSCFANGAIKAIKFISKVKENKIYTTEEILGS
ncbi:MAG: 4-hydroxy-tetrahydrodipicolinate reductase [Candidatus Lokiarchaeota archaeon]|nr:4-hydroxy-tetrahydrodipicolinate reductase [Candidatus Lokiarchaeota archaeon]